LLDKLALSSKKACLFENTFVFFGLPSRVAANFSRKPCYMDMRSHYRIFILRDDYIIRNTISQAFFSLIVEKRGKIGIIYAKSDKNTPNTLLKE